MTTDFKRNSLGRTRIYEYTPLKLMLWLRPSLWHTPLEILQKLNSCSKTATTSWSLREWLKQCTLTNSCSFIVSRNNAKGMKLQYTCIACLIFVRGHKFLGELLEDGQEYQKALESYKRFYKNLFSYWCNNHGWKNCRSILSWKKLFENKPSRCIQFLNILSCSQDIHLLKHAN